MAPRPVSTAPMAHAHEPPRPAIDLESTLARPWAASPYSPTDLSPLSSAGSSSKRLLPPLTVVKGLGSAEGEALSSPGFHRLPLWRKVSREAWILVKLSAPAALGALLAFANKLSTIVVVGHLPDDSAGYLASSSLAMLSINVFGYSLINGMSGALETLCSQAVGSRDASVPGLILQRGVIVMVFLGIVSCILQFFFAEAFFLALGQDPILASMAQTYLRCLLPALIPNAIQLCIVKFQNAQLIFAAPSLILMVVLPLNILLQWFVVYADTPFKIGFYGAPLAASLMDFASLGLITWYTAKVDGWQAWDGFTWKAWDLHGIITFLKLGIPSMLMVVTEWWIFEMAAVVAGWLGQVPLAAQTVVLNIAGLCYMVFFGLGVANSNRTGNLLGSYQAMRARISAWTCIGLGGFAAIGTAGLLVAFRWQLPRMFTDDPEVIALVAELLPIAALFQIFDGLGCIGGGVVRGMGRQTLGAAVNCIAYYAIAVPVACGLVFGAHLGLKGLWFAFSIGLCAAATFYMLIVYLTDWDVECLKARDRVRGEAEGLSHHRPGSAQSPGLTDPLSHDSHGSQGSSVHRSRTGPYLEVVQDEDMEHLELQLPSP